MPRHLDELKRLCAELADRLGCNDSLVLQWYCDVEIHESLESRYPSRLNPERLAQPRYRQPFADRRLAGRATQHDRAAKVDRLLARH